MFTRKKILEAHENGYTILFWTLYIILLNTIILCRMKSTSESGLQKGESFEEEEEEELRGERWGVRKKRREREK